MHFKIDRKHLFPPECRNAGGFFLCENINDSRIRTKYVPYHFKQQF